MNLQRFKADLAYQKIYRCAKRKLLIIDDYISTKTLQHLLHSKPAVKLTVISDIILDYNTKDMRIYHCGASSKDAGKKITTITQIKDMTGYIDMIKNLLANPPLVLR